jgi:uncharacterized protein (DUF2141 family)
MKSATITALFALAFSAALSSAAFAAEGGASCEGQNTGTKLTVQVTGVRSAKGEMAITVYPDDASQFLAPHRKLARVRAPTQAPVTTACFWLPAPGYYALAIYHDENGNDRFDRSIVGMPEEGFAFSNDPPTPSALPPFKAVRFKVGDGETKIHVKLKYLK